MRAYQFKNGMMMVFDDQGEQMPDYQGETKKFLPKLLKDFPNCVVIDARWDGKRENPIVPVYKDGTDIKANSR